MSKNSIRALGALVLCGLPAAALAQDFARPQDAAASETPAAPATTSDLEAATPGLTGSSNDVGWDAMTPQETAVRKGAEPDTMKMKLTPFYSYEDVGDLEDDAGNVEVSRWGADLRMDYIDQGGHMWAFRFGWEESDYDISDTPAAGAAEDALDNATVWSLSLVHQRRIDERWSAFGGVGMQYGGADGVSFSDGRNFMGGLGGIYDVNEDLTVGLGILVKEDFDDSAEVLPIPMLTYRIDEKTFVRLRGARADISHKVDDRITLRGLLELENRSYRLDDDVAGAPDGAVNDSHVLLGFGLDFAATETVTLRGKVGVILGQEYEIEDDRGSEIDTIDGDDTGFFVGLEAIVAF